VKKPVKNRWLGQTGPKGGQHSLKKTNPKQDPQIGKPEQIPGGGGGVTTRKKTRLEGKSLKVIKKNGKKEGPLQGKNGTTMDSKKLSTKKARFLCEKLESSWRMGGN